MKWRIAHKYLLSRKSHSVINIIASISVVAVAVPVAAMIILLSVFNGFEGLVRELYAAVDADIEVVAAEGGRIDDVQTLQNEIAQMEGVAACSAIVEQQALLTFRNRHMVARVRGVDQEYTEVVPIANHITLGTADVQLGDFDRLIIGEGVARTLGIFSTAGRGIDIATATEGAFGALMLRHEELPIEGFFLIDSRNDSELVITTLRATERLFDAEHQATALLVKLEDNASAEKLCRAIEEQHTTLRATSRERKNSAFYAIMRYEKWAIFFISLMVLIVAALSITGTIIMLIIEKRNEQRLLYALGADTAYIRGIFLREGMLISGAGGVVGIVLGVALTLVQQTLGIIKMPQGGFLIEAYPVSLHATDIALVAVWLVAIALAITATATYTMIKRKKPCDTEH